MLHLSPTLKTSLHVEKQQENSCKIQLLDTKLLVGMVQAFLAPFIFKVQENLSAYASI